MADITATNPANNTASDFVLQKTARLPKNQLDKDAFMAILLAQLQHQDPSSPMDNTDMAAQLASFTQLEAVNAMSNASLTTQAYSLIGKGVVGYVRDGVTNAVTEIIGTADSAGLESGKPYVKIGNAMIWLDDISQVFDNSIISGDSAGLMAGTAMVGKYVRAQYLDGTYIEGQVERVTVRDGKLFVSVDGTEVGLYQIVNVAASIGDLGSAPAAYEQPAAE
ncbi:MAG: hypothetical protein LBI44_02895 [Oscillospiraceae bacterium]|jgi:flagellar basal-body rod modification protein FlgD|nr:hypothetical protein [Oscillospiraceae bacterium]